MQERDKVHFVGAAGFGVSALAQFHVMGGGALSAIAILSIKEYRNAALE